MMQLMKFLHAISGAVGTFANIHPNIERHVAKSLSKSRTTTQIIPRDRHAFISQF